jgi:hypothetical protein
MNNLAELLKLGGEIGRFVKQEGRVAKASSRAQSNLPLPTSRRFPTISRKSHATRNS